MKILLTSDWHLGKSLYHQKLLEYQEKFFLQEFVPLISDVKPDLLIVAGDILDRPIPDKDSLSLFGEILKELASRKVKSFFILGNHDSRRTALHKFFLELGGIHIIDDLRYFINPYVITDGSGTEIHLYFLPYLSPYEMEEIFLQYGFVLDGVHKFYTGEFLKNIMKQFTVRRPAIFIGHFAIAGFELAGEELSIRGLSLDYVIEEERFSDFDILFLGHLHSPQVRNHRIFYPGAPLPYSFETADVKRGIFLIEILGGNVNHYEFIELTSPYRLLTIEDTFSEILKMPETDDFLKIILTDREPIYEAFHRLRTKFRNLLYLDYKKIIEFSNEEFLISEFDDINFESFDLKIDELRLFREFYKYITKEEPDERVINTFKAHLENFYRILNSQS